MSELLVIVPTRGRRGQCERLLKSFTETTDFADITFITDGDDQETYEGMDWGPATHGVLSPRESLSGKLNRTADAYVGAYDNLFFVGDDHVFLTEHWDTILLAAMKDMGGSGIVYPDDRRRNDVPEIWMVSSDIIRALGHFAEPSFKHFYLDNAWADLGRRTDLLRFVPEVVIEHRHYSVCAETEHDGVYRETENAWGGSDAEAFRYWRANKMAVQVAQLRRALNPDVKWITGKV